MRESQGGIALTNGRAEPRVSGTFDTLEGYLKQQLAPAFEELMLAYLCAQDLKQDPIEYSVAVSRLLQKGASEPFLRWLVCKGLATHFDAQTHSKENGRPPNQTTILGTHSSIALTESGAAFASQLLNPNGEATTTGSEAARGTNGACKLTPVVAPVIESRRAVDMESVPLWDSERSELRFGARLVKQFRLPSPNQRIVLTAFQEDGWPARIDDPLPPVSNQDTRVRLQNTIKGLNRNQANQLMRFRGDGTGEGIIWERLTTR